MNIGVRRVFFKRNRLVELSRIAYRHLIMHRLFIGLRPPPAIRASLRGLMIGVPGARWQEDDQLHVTVRYIGEVDRRMAEDIAVLLGGVHSPAIDVRLAGTGRFESKAVTDTLWAGLTPTASLTVLHQKVDHALVRLGLASESRAYLPHITLARFTRSMGTAPEIEEFLARHAALTSNTFTMTHLTLFESHLSSARATYETINRWPLG